MGRPAKTAPGVGERLAEVRGEMDREAFARSIGVHGNTVANYERGDRKVDPDFLAKLREVLGVDINWLLTGVRGKGGKGQSQHQSLTMADSMVSIPRYAVQASAGGGAVAIAQDVEDFFYVNRDWLASIAPRGARLGMLGGRGDSMEPTISDGDVLIVTFDVNRQDLAAGGIFVFTYEGDIYLKRLSLALDGSVQVISDNPSYPMQTIAAEVAEAKLEINARVIWAGGRLR